jgi:hypothetical protein
LFISNVSCIGAEFFFFMRHDRRYSFALENRPKLGGVMPVRAPVTTMDNGTPRPSTRIWRLLPFFSPIRGVRPGTLKR